MFSLPPNAGAPHPRSVVDKRPRLFLEDCLHQVARLVHIDAVLNCQLVGK